MGVWAWAGSQNITAGDAVCVCTRFIENQGGTFCVPEHSVNCWAAVIPCSDPALDSSDPALDSPHTYPTSLDTLLHPSAQTRTHSHSPAVAFVTLPNTRMRARTHR